MSQMNAMKQIGVRNLGFHVEIMKWSNKMDLIAMGNDKGEVIIQRLNWQKICTFPSPGENIKVKAISWQPDEPVIAVAYSSGKVSLLDVEKDEEIYTFDLGTDIKTLHWTKPVAIQGYTDDFAVELDAKLDDYLPPLPNLNTLSSAGRKSTVNFTKGSPSFLVVSLVTGKICLSVLGILPCGSINIIECIGYPNDYDVYDVQMGATIDEIYVFLRDGILINVLVFKNIILSKYIRSLLKLATKHGHVLETLNYMNDTIQCIIEAWETVLLEMDNKLTKYANSHSEGTISADFLELLMFGVPSPQLEQFLTRELTEKGLKKLGTSIELSYSTLQNLIVKPLHSAATNLFYHLNILKGYSQNTYFYKDLISFEATEIASITAGGLLLKVLELQQTIDKSATDYKLFWCWLSVVIQRLIDEGGGDDIGAVTQEDLSYLAEFLYNFDECIFIKDDGTHVRQKFNLDRIGQYFEDTNMNTIFKIDNFHDWNNLMSENECLRNSKLIYPHNTNHSLIQEHNNLKDAICNVFAKPNKSIADAFYLKSRIYCGEITPEKCIHTSYFVNKTTHSDYILISLNPKEIVFIESNSLFNTMMATKLFISCDSQSMETNRLFEDAILKDIKFYNDNTISLLLQATAEDQKLSNYIVQLPIEAIKEKSTAFYIAREINLMVISSTFDIIDAFDSNYFKILDGQCTMIAVSGIRKVAAVLSDNCRKMRIYEMEIEDDDDEMDVSQNLILDTSKESAASVDQKLN